MVVQQDEIIYTDFVVIDSGMTLNQMDALQ
jgi:hypothetical protein